MTTKHFPISTAKLTFPEIMHYQNMRDLNSRSRADDLHYDEAVKLKLPSVRNEAAYKVVQTGFTTGKPALPPKKKPATKVPPKNIKMTTNTGAVAYLMSSTAMKKPSKPAPQPTVLVVSGAGGERQVSGKPAVGAIQKSIGINTIKSAKPTSRNDTLTSAKKGKVTSTNRPIISSKTIYPADRVDHKRQSMNTYQPNINPHSFREDEGGRVTDFGNHDEQFKDLGFLNNAKSIVVFNFNSDEEETNGNNATNILGSSLFGGGPLLRDEPVNEVLSVIESHTHNIELIVEELGSLLKPPWYDLKFLNCYEHLFQSFIAIIERSASQASSINHEALLAKTIMTIFKIADDSFSDLSTDFKVFFTAIANTAKKLLNLNNYPQRTTAVKFIRCFYVLLENCVRKTVYYDEETNNFIVGTMLGFAIEVFTAFKTSPQDSLLHSRITPLIDTLIKVKDTRQALITPPTDNYEGPDLYGTFNTLTQSIIVLLNDKSAEHSDASFIAAYCVLVFSKYKDTSRYVEAIASRLRGSEAPLLVSKAISKLVQAWNNERIMRTMGDLVKSSVGQLTTLLSNEALKEENPALVSEAAAEVGKFMSDGERSGLVMKIVSKDVLDTLNKTIQANT